MVKACREAVGEDYPLFIRISADEFLGGKGLTIDEMAKVYAPLIQDLAIHCINVSARIP